MENEWYGTKICTFPWTIELNIQHFHFRMNVLTWGDFFSFCFQNVMNLNFILEISPLWFVSILKCTTFDIQASHNSNKNHVPLSYSLYHSLSLRFSALIIFPISRWFFIPLWIVHKYIQDTHVISYAAMARHILFDFWYYATQPKAC